jgi:hypothetical protein
MAQTRSISRAKAFQKTRRAKSRCVGIKGIRACKRTQGCKRTVGPVRKFCRTMKNRKLRKA